MREYKISNDRKKSLMDSAIREFAERGFEKASYNKIIERSGLSKGTVYYYFENKESLLNMLLNEITDQFIAISDGLNLPDTKEEFWKIDSEYHRRAMNFFFESPYSDLFYLLFSNDQTINSKMSDFTEHMLSFRYRLIERGQSLGAVRSDMSVETISKIIQEIGKVLSASMIKKTGSFENESEMQNDVKKFVEVMRDLSIRILTPSN